MYSTPEEAFLQFNDDPKPHLGKLQNLARTAGANLPLKPTKIHTIAIIGLRGVGKSTLALMASADLGFTYLDVEKCISHHTNKPEAEYLKEVSIEAYQELQYELIKASLCENVEKNSIVVMPSTIINSSKLIHFLHSGRFSLVINMECEVDRILSYMKYQGNYGDGAELVCRRFEQYRSLATHDFFNYFSDSDSEMQLSVEEKRAFVESNFFLLKPVQRDFSRFLIFLIRGPSAAWAYTGNLHLLSQISERFTNCLHISVPNPTQKLNVLDLMGVDFLELDVSMIELLCESKKSRYSLLNENYARARRVSRSSVPIIVSITVTREDISTFMLEAGSGDNAASAKKSMLNFYLYVLHSALRLGPDYLSLDLGILKGDEEGSFFDGTPQKSSQDIPYRELLDHFVSLNSISGSTQLIGTYLSEASDFWDSKATEIVDLAMRLNLKIIRLASVTTKVSENLQIHEFLSKMKTSAPHIRICAYNRGYMGQLSKVLNKYMTPVSLENDVISAYTAHSLQCALVSAGLSPKLKFFVIGSNVSKSASPLLYRTAFQVMGLPHTFEPYECTELQPHLGNIMKHPFFGGAAILMPFKSQIIGSMHSVSSHVKVIGAMNTIVANRPLESPEKVTSFRGENTDWLGVKIALSGNTSPINSARQDKTALVLGAGGMARSAIYALVQLGYGRIYLYNRTGDRANELASYYNSISPMLPSKSLTLGEMCDSQKELLYFKLEVISDADLSTGSFVREMDKDISAPLCIISCIPSIDRHTGNRINVPIHDAWFSSSTGGTFLETNYVPLESSALERAKMFGVKGWVAVNGLTWLLCQIIAQFEMFTGKQAPVALFKKTAQMFLEANLKDVDIV